ncbi:hypothetical protein ABIB57_002684 [Devosia sp. UYZn731]
MPADTIVVICAVVAFFSVFMGALGYGQWITRDLP